MSGSIKTSDLVIVDEKRYEWPLGGSGSGGGSSQMFVYMGDNGEVLIASDPSGPSGEPGPTGATADFTQPGSIDFDIGYAAAIKDVLAQIIVAGKQNLVQWLEKKLEQL